MGATGSMMGLSGSSHLTRPPPITDLNSQYPCRECNKVFNRQGKSTDEGDSFQRLTIFSTHRTTGLPHGLPPALQVQCQCLRKGVQVKGAAGTSPRRLTRSRLGGHRIADAHSHRQQRRWWWSSIAGGRLGLWSRVCCLCFGFRWHRWRCWWWQHCSELLCAAPLRQPPADHEDEGGLLL